VVRDGRLFTGEYSGGMYIDLGFAGRQAIEVLEVKVNESMRRNWDKMTKKDQRQAMETHILEWVRYMDDPKDDGHWEGWYQDYVDASRE
jgi:hypothetical protein